VRPIPCGGRCTCLWVGSATEAFIAGPQQAADDFAWYRNDWHQLQAAKDGITVDASGISPLVRAVAKISPVSREQDDQGWLDNTRNVHVAAAAAFGTLVAQDEHDPVQRVNAGRIWQRMHLSATTQGLAVQPPNQVIERAEREVCGGLVPEFARALEALVPDPNREALMPFRIGYPHRGAAGEPAPPRLRDVAAHRLLEDQRGRCSAPGSSVTINSSGNPANDRLACSLARYR